MQYALRLTVRCAISFCHLGENLIYATLIFFILSKAIIPYIWILWYFYKQMLKRANFLFLLFMIISSKDNIIHCNYLNLSFFHVRNKILCKTYLSNKGKKFPLFSSICWCNFIGCCRMQRYVNAVFLQYTPYYRTQFWYIWNILYISNYYRIAERGLFRQVL